MADATAALAAAVNADAAVKYDNGDDDGGDDVTAYKWIVQDNLTICGI